MPSSYNRSCICCAIIYNSCNWKLGVTVSCKVVREWRCFSSIVKGIPKNKINTTSPGFFSLFCYLTPQCFRARFYDSCKISWNTIIKSGGDFALVLNVIGGVHMSNRQTGQTGIMHYCILAQYTNTQNH